MVVRLSVCAFVTLVTCLPLGGCGGVLSDGTARGNFQDSNDARGGVPGNDNNNPGDGGITPPGSGTGCVALGAALSAAGNAGTSPATVLSMELNATTGNPTVAWSLGSAAGAKPVYVSSYDGSRWKGLAGSDTGVGLGSSSGGVALKLGATGLPYAAWLNTDSSTLAFLKSWSGTAWTGLGGSDAGLPEQYPDEMFPQLRMMLATGDLPVLVWQDSANTGIPNVHGIQWSGGWTDLTPHAVFNSSTTPLAAYPEVLRAADGTPLIVYSDGSGISVDGDASSSNLTITTNGAPSTATHVTGALKSNGDLLVAWQDITLTGGQGIFVKLMSSSVGWVDLTGSAAGTGLIQSSAAGSQHPSLALDAQDNPVVAWEDLTTHQIIVRHYDGTNWAGPPSAPAAVSQATTLAAWPVVRVQGGKAVVAWHQDGATVRVCRVGL